ncbi:MAG: SurA N-terminal domain-containing protein [Thermodesulfobacteriota bacterium]
MTAYFACAEKGERVNPYDSREIIRKSPKRALLPNLNFISFPMLQIFRNKAQSIFIQAIVLVIALVFIFWGVGANMMGNREAAAVVNDQEITFQEFQQAYDRTAAGYRQQFGGTMPPELLETLGIKQQVITQLIQGELLRQGAAEMGIIISQKEVRATIENMKEFMDDGSFNIDRYKSVLTSNRLTPRKFESSMQYDLLASRVVAEIGKFGEVIGDQALTELFQTDREEISLSYVKIVPQPFLAKVEINDDELEKWYQKNQSNYKTDAQIKLNYLPFTYEDSEGDKEFSEEELKSRYEADIASYRTPEERHARHILFKTEQAATPEQDKELRKKIDDVLKRAREGEDFAAMAKIYSEGPSADGGGDLGFFAKGQMVPAFDATVFSMKVGEISDIVKTSFGYHIIKLEATRGGETKSFEDVRDKVAAKAREELVKPLTFEAANQAYEAIMAAGSLKAYDEKQDKSKLQKTDFFGPAAIPQQLAGDPELSNRAFALKKGELSSLVETPRGYFILFAEDRMEPVVPPLAEVNDRLTADYKRETAMAMARKEAQTILDRAATGEELNTLAAEFELTVNDSGFMGRSNAQPPSPKDFPAALRQSAFLLGPQSPLPKEIGAANDTFYVYRFQERRIPKGEEMNEEDKKRYRATLVELNKDQLLNSWLQLQQEKAEIYTSKNL